MLYKEVYDIIGDLTPIKADCGELCNKACCEGDDETGMYLFPFEEEIYEKKLKWLDIYESEFEYGQNKAKIAICNNSCDRKFRPLSCRIFPLTPYINEKDEFSIVMDKRAKGICPIAFAIEKEDLDQEFVQAVEKAMKLLMKNRN